MGRKSERQRKSSYIDRKEQMGDEQGQRGGHVGRCHQLEGKELEFDQMTGIYLRDSWALWEIQKNAELFWAG